MGTRLYAALAEITPLLADAGFLPTYYGTPPDGLVGVTYCAAFDDFARRFPHLPQSHEHEADLGRCVDLIIRVDRTDRITELHLEGHSFDDTCRRIGPAEDAQAAALLIGAEALDAMATLRPILESFFG